MPHPAVMVNAKLLRFPERWQKLGENEAYRHNWRDLSGTRAVHRTRPGHCEGSGSDFSACRRRLRAILVVMLIATPGLMLPATSDDAAQIVTLVAIFAAALVIFEYPSSYPGLIEFRRRTAVQPDPVPVPLRDGLPARHDYARPGRADEPDHARRGRGPPVGHVIDFPYSPVRLVVLMLPPDATVEQIEARPVPAGVGLSHFVITLALFSMASDLSVGPLGSGAQRLGEPADFDPRRAATSSKPRPRRTV